MSLCPNIITLTPYSFAHSFEQKNWPSFMIASLSTTKVLQAAHSTMISPSSFLDLALGVSPLESLKKKRYTKTNAIIKKTILKTIQLPHQDIVPIFSRVYFSTFKVF